MYTNANIRIGLVLLLLSVGCRDTAVVDPPGETPPAEPPGPEPSDWSPPARIPTLPAAVYGTHLISSLALDALGGLHAVTLEQSRAGETRGKGLRVAYVRRENGNWSEPVGIDTTAAVSELPRVVAGPDRQIHVFWYENLRLPAQPRTVTDLLQRTWDGTRWSAPTSLYQETGRFGIVASSLAATLDGGGRIHVIHHTDGRGFGHLVRGRDGWLPASYLNQPGPYASWVRRVGAGDLELTWIGGIIPPGGGSARSDVLTRSLRGAGWTPAVEVMRDPLNYSHAPQMVIDATGLRHVVWLEGANGQLSPRAVLYSTSRDGIAWSPPTDITPAERAGQWLASPRLVVDRKDRLHLVFSRFESDAGNPAHFYMRRENGAWSPAQRLFASLGVSNTEIEIAFDGRDTIHAVWRSGDGNFYSSTLDVSR